jgi:hypothetical protein
MAPIVALIAQKTGVFCGLKKAAKNAYPGGHIILQLNI